MISLQALERYAGELLDTQSFEDYCPNGIQVEVTPTVRRLVTGVTASQALIEAAAAFQADALLVHHGYFWKGEPAPIRGIKGTRIRSLYRNNLNLLAYHLPLDAHPELGNNRQLAIKMGFEKARPAKKEALIWQTELDHPMEPAELKTRITGALNREPLHIAGGKKTVKRIGWCSGAAQDLVEKAAALELDAFITGEISERTPHLAHELEIHFFAAGHHATERFGVEALGNHIAQRFSLEHRFIDIPNPV